MQTWALCTNRWCFLAGNCNRVAHEENTRRDISDLTLDMRLERLYMYTELQQLMLMDLLVKMDSIMGFRLDKWLLSCNSPSIKCFLYRIMVFLPSIYIITHTELKIPTNHGSKYTSCVFDGRIMSGQSITDANNFNIYCFVNTKRSDFETEWIFWIPQKKTL